MSGGSIRVQLGDSQSMVDIHPGDLISIVYIGTYRQCSEYLLTHTDNVRSFRIKGASVLLSDSLPVIQKRLTKGGGGGGGLTLRRWGVSARESRTAVFPSPKTDLPTKMAPASLVKSPESSTGAIVLSPFFSPTCSPDCTVALSLNPLKLPYQDPNKLAMEVQPLLAQVCRNTMG